MLYPPILATTQPVVDSAILRKNGLVINFTLASITSVDEFDGIDLIISKQSNNAEVVSSHYTTDQFTLDNKAGKIVEKSSTVINKIEAGCLYKVQLRLTHQTEVSEWSTVLIIKFITTPLLKISAEDVVLTSGSYVLSLTPTFKGVCNLNVSDKEIEEVFRFRLYQGSALQLESDWIPHIVGQEDQWYCNMKLTGHTYYSILYEIRTVNGYQTFNYCSFQVIPPIEDELNVTFLAESNIQKARIDLFVSPTLLGETLDGLYVISRSSEKDNFTQFEDLRFITFKNYTMAPDVAIFSDYTAESGIRYKYGFQKTIGTQRRSKMKETDIVSIDYEYSYLYRDGIQLQLSFNQKINSFKHTVLRNKQDTIGSKYPYLSQNGNAYYAEFALAGLISYQDNIDTFFNVHSDGNVYYKDELIINQNKFSNDSAKREASSGSGGSAQSIFDHRSGYEFSLAAQERYYAYENDTVATESRRSDEPIPTEEESSDVGESVETETVLDYTISTDLLDNNIFIERKFREKVEEFLNDFNGKLFKSPTEGNITVVLFNVSYRPVDIVNRMIYEFTATAYEIADNTIEDLNTYGIIEVDPESNHNNEEIQQYFGQVQIDQFSTNIIQAIKDQIANDVDDSYLLKDLETLWIEVSIPRENLTSLYYPLYIDGEKILLPTQRIYTMTLPTDALSKEDNEITLILEQNHYPLVINYKGTIQENPDKKTSLSIQEDVYDFGQVIWNKSDGSDLIAFIQDSLATRNKWIQVDEDEQTGLKTWKDTNGVKWSFNHLRFIDIESQKGAVISIGPNEAEKVDFKIGYTKIGDNEYRENLFDSNRIIFPAKQDEISDSNTAYLQITGEAAAQALINFSYYVKKETITKV